METKLCFWRTLDAQDQTRNFAYAMGFGPLPDGMPFLFPVELESKLKFWEVNPRRPGLYVEDDGCVARKWPDFLGHGGGSPSFFVSKKVVDSLTCAGLPIARLTPMPIAEVKCKSLKASDAPDYFVLEAPYGIDLDDKASGISADANGKRIFPKSRSAWRLSLPTWNGSDLFSWPNIWKIPSTMLLCTDKVVELARREGWTNCRFEPIWAV